MSKMGAWSALVYAQSCHLDRASAAIRMQVPTAICYRRFAKALWLGRKIAQASRRERGKRERELSVDWLPLAEIDARSNAMSMPKKGRLGDKAAPIDAARSLPKGSGRKFKRPRVPGP